MPTKRRKNSGPVVKRKLGSAKPAPEEAAAALPATEGAPGAPAQGASSDATQPLPAAPAGVSATAAAPSPDAPGAPRKKGVVPGVSISVDDGTPAPEGPPSEEPSDPTKPTRRSVKRKKAKGKGKAEGAVEQEAPSPTPTATPSDAPSADEEAKGDQAEKAEKAKHPKPPSKRKQRRAERKEAKAAKRAAMTPLQRLLRRLRTLLIVLVVLVVVAAGAVVGALSYHRWYAYDDALDIQGTWYVSGTNTPIEVTGDTIVLTPDVAYHYTLDPSSKTITFTFGRLRGEGHYRFALDRQYLVIFDGAYTWEQSLSTDVSWLLRALADEAMSTPNNLAQGAFYNVTLLSRSSAEGSDVSASVVATAEGPRVVWSAPDAEGAGGDAPAGGDAAPTGGEGATGDGASSGDASAGSAASPSGASDVDSLLGAINDLPAD